MQQSPPFRLAVPSVLQAGALAIGFAGAVPALAADSPATPPWSFSGFGTLSTVHSSQRQADFVSSVLKASGAGHSDAWSTDVDSRLGAQIDVAPGQRWSAVLQVISEQQYQNNYRPVVEWANVRWQATPDLALRAGRIALPMFLAADYRKIGYVYPWARPPVELYGVIPVSSSDGIDLTWGWQALGVRHSTQAYYGHRDMRLTDTMRLRARRVTGISNTMQYGAVSARISMMSAEITLDNGRALFDALAAFGPRGQRLLDDYSADHKRASAFGFGVDYDPGPWFLTAEANQTRTRTFLGKTSAAYAGAGYRWGTLTPWIGYARARVDSPTSDPGLSLAGLPPAAARTAAALNAGLNTLLKSIPDQSTFSVGVRWDFLRDFALKLEYQRLKPRNGSRGTLVNVQPGFRAEHRIEIATVALDFVF
jgi:hypothetical protein